MEKGSSARERFREKRGWVGMVVECGRGGSGTSGVSVEVVFDAVGRVRNSSGSLRVIEGMGLAGGGLLCESIDVSKLVRRRHFPIIANLTHICLVAGLENSWIIV